MKQVKRDDPLNLATRPALFLASLSLHHSCAHAWYQATFEKSWASPPDTRI